MMLVSVVWTDSLNWGDFPSFVKPLLIGLFEITTELRLFNY